MSSAESNKPINVKNTVRLGYPDKAKGLGMLMIMLGHLSYLSEPVFSFCASIKILIFYIVSGYLFAYKEDIGENVVTKNEYLIRRSHSIGIPYLIFSAAALAADLVFALISGSDISAVLRRDLMYTITLKGVSTLWFLPTIFFADAIFVFGDRIIKKLRYPILFILPLAAHFICKGYRLTVYPIKDDGAVQAVMDGAVGVISKSIIALGFVVYGYVLYTALKNIPKNFYTVMFACVGLIVVIILTRINRGIDLNNVKCGKFPAMYIFNGYLCGTVIMFLLKCFDDKADLRLLSFIGKNSLFIMATHLPWKLCLVIKKAFGAVYTARKADLTYYLILLCALAVLLLAEYLMIRIKELVKHRVEKWVYK